MHVSQRGDGIFALFHGMDSGTFSQPQDRCGDRVRTSGLRRLSSSGSPTAAQGAAE